MKKLDIHNLYINKASYFATDAHGNKLLVMVNYWEGVYKLKTLKKKDGNIELLAKEAGKLARDLIKRKSRVDFAS